MGNHHVIMDDMNPIISTRNSDANGLWLEGETICQEADRLVTNDRQEQYGHPLDNFTDIGRIFGTILGIDDVSPEKVGMMLVGLKLCREKFKHKRDNLTDGCGFFKTIDLIHTERERRKNL